MKNEIKYKDKFIHAYTIGKEKSREKLFSNDGKTNISN